ncbi:hypothetical protein OG235_27650 [Streptomyces sp. NBC_00024]|uniref:hypothetical protein n=1 Tax=Streptomyces sp. NBC_00024 TaxID=2903612 RepID=UPI003251FCF4
MCIRVRYATRCQIGDPWDAGRNVITLPDHLIEPYALQALQILLAELDIEQAGFGARCWCGEQIKLPPRIPQQRTSEQVSNLGA